MKNSSAFVKCARHKNGLCKIETCNGLIKVLRDAPFVTQDFETKFLGICYLVDPPYTQDISQEDLILNNTCNSTRENSKSKTFDVFKRLDTIVESACDGSANDEFLYSRKDYIDTVNEIWNNQGNPLYAISVEEFPKISAIWRKIRLNLVTRLSTFASKTPADAGVLLVGLHYIVVFAASAASPEIFGGGWAGNVSPSRSSRIARSGFGST